MNTDNIYDVLPGEEDNFEEEDALQQETPPQRWCSCATRFHSRDPAHPALVDFHRQVTHGPPPSFHVAWKKPRRCQPLCTPPNQDARLKWRLWLDFRCPASHFSCLRCSFLMFILVKKFIQIHTS